MVYLCWPASCFVHEGTAFYILYLHGMFQISGSHDNFQKENGTKQKQAYKVASVLGSIFDHFGVGGAPRDTLKQSIADQSGLWCAFWEASGPSGSSVFSPGSPEGRQKLSLIHI